MTTPIESFNRKDCDLIPGVKVNAYTDLYLDPENPTGIILDTTWGLSKVDLMSVVKAGETITHLYLAPEDDPVGLCYEKEDGTTDWIHGDDLSRIISMTLLKDVDQEQPISGGDVYMYNSVTKKFEPFALQTFVNETNQHLTNLDNAVTNLQNQINALNGRISAIENAIFNWGNDKNTKIPRGNINVYGDIGNTGNHDWGIFSHDKNNNITNDLYFS